MHIHFLPAIPDRVRKRVSPKHPKGRNTLSKYATAAPSHNESSPQIEDEIMKEAGSSPLMKVIVSLAQPKRSRAAAELTSGISAKSTKESASEPSVQDGTNMFRIRSVNLPLSFSSMMKAKGSARKNAAPFLQPIVKGIARTGRGEASYSDECCGNKKSVGSP